MSNYKTNLILFINRFILIVAVYQICRILFYCVNLELFNNLSIRVFSGGLLFDLAAVAYINIPFLIAHLFPGNFKYSPKYQKILLVSFYVVNLAFIATNFIDIIYYRFTGRRSTYAMITADGMEHDVIRLIPSFLKEFWYIAILFIITGFVLWKLLPKAKSPITPKELNRRDYVQKAIYTVISIFVVLLMIRGGVQKKPIKIVDGMRYGNLNTSALVLNTPFTILKTAFKKKELEKVHYYSDSELKSIYNPVLSINPKLPADKKNVVVIILESFGNENIHCGQTPFLDSLITKAHYFKNGFANGKVSIDAVPSTISSIPSLMNNSFITSGYALNKTKSLPQILKKEGYNTSFFHGAFNGSQNFDQYCKVAGFDEYYGKDQYVGSPAFDGKWGIFDEEFLQFFAAKLTSFKQPFFSSIFTISSHNPYIIPEKYKGKFPKGNTEIQESIAYTDFALRKFFKSAKKEKWYNNTLFVITADHTSSSGTSEADKTNVGKFRIPILFFDPSNPSFNVADEKNFQQIDIMPSILDYLNIKAEIISFGKSFKSQQNFAVYYLQDTYHCIVDDYYLAFANNRTIGLYNWKKDTLLKHNLIETNKPKANELERFLKGYIQSFNNRVIDNQLSFD
ncbi:LTA synthase family protein [Flavobacterium ginsengisoli]|uniref:LTA synthase family protein n=1 Tax=Flavobacterium ginsengisoli TaxID=871694 RepID=A0ABP7F883_9FLAO